MPEQVDISEWEQEEHPQENIIILKFSDFESINREVLDKKDSALALERVGQWLFSHDYGVIAAKRDKETGAWLAKCTLP